MQSRISDFYNIRKTPSVTLESIEEKLRISSKALSKLAFIKSTRHDKTIIAKEMAYINAVLPTPIKISMEDTDAVIIDKIGEAEKMVNSVVSELTQQHDSLVNEADEAMLKEPCKEEPKPEVEPIVKYPLNENTLTTYAITTPNLLNATAAVLQQKGDVVNKEVGPGSVVDTAKTLLDDIATRKEVVEVAKETYDEKLSIIDNAVKFFNSPSGNRWLLSKEGKKWINYVVYKNNISVENNLPILPQADYNIFANEQEDELEALITMESNAEAINLEILKKDERMIEKDDEASMAELSANADKISRLEDEMTLIAAGIDKIDELQANQVLTVESAAYYNKVLEQMKSEAANHIGLKDIEKYELAKEDFEYDPAGGLTISREGLVEMLHSVYEFFKKLISKVINWLKRYFGKISISSKVQTAKAKSLLSKLKSKKDLTKDQFDTVQVSLVEKYRAMLYMMDYNLGQADAYLTSIIKNPIRKTIQNPLKQVYNILNKLNSDVNNNKKEELVNDAKDIAEAMSKDNILNKALAGRSSFIKKLDKKVEGKKGAEIVPLICSYKGSYGLVAEESSFGGETLNKYSLQPLTFKSIEGIFTKVPTKSEIESALKKASLSSNDSSIIYKEMEEVIKYGESFIDSFKKFKKNKWGDSSTSKEVSTAISTITSYAKSITIQYVVYEVNSYVYNCKAINAICEKLIGAME